MIINTEISDTEYNGFKTKLLKVSYLNKEGKTDFKDFVLMPQELFRWDYAKQNEIPDKNFKSWDDRPVIKIPLKYTERFPDTRIHEILFNMIQNHPELSEIYDFVMPELSFCDIEVMVGEDGFPLAEEAKNQVNTISWVYGNEVYVLGLCKLTNEQIHSIQKRIDKHCEKFATRYEFTYLYFETEYDMLSYFIEYFVKPAVAICGWNFLRYDWKYIINRCALYGIDTKWISPTGKWTNYSLLKLFNKKTAAEKVRIPMHKIIFDYMEVYQKWDTAIYPHDSLKLDDVGEAAVKVNKVQHTMGFNEMWEKAPEDYVFYNAVDSILVREIHNELKTANIFFSLANLIHCELMVAFSPVRSLQTFQTEYIYRENQVFVTEYATENDEDEVKEKYEGAFVYEPNPGKFKNVVALDFASLYPTTMRQFNISPDTFIKKDPNYTPKDDEMKTITGAVYKRDEPGILPRILTDVYNQRKAYKKEMQIAEEEMHELEDILNNRMKGTQQSSQQQSQQQKQ